MSRLARTSLVVSAALLMAPPADAQIEIGRLYSGGEQISEPELGLRLTLPTGWHGRLTPDGEAFVLGSEEGGGYIFVLADESTEAEARAQMTEPVDLGDGVVLRPAGAVQSVASGHLTAPYSVSGAQAELTGTMDVRLTQSGLGVAFILVSPAAEAERHREALRELAFSLGIEEPAVQPAAGGDEWEPYLRGKYLARFYTDTGYTESTEIWLCSDGAFHFSSQGGGFGGGASGAALSSGGGRWSASGAGATGTLLLEWGNGERSSWDLSYDYEQNRLFLNGERMLRGNNERCS